MSPAPASGPRKARRSPVNAESTISINADLLATAFDHAPVGVGICDQDGRFIAVNTYLATLLHHPKHDIVGRPFLAFVHPTERAASLAAYFEAVIAAATRARIRSDSCTLRCLTGDASLIQVSVHWTVTEPDQSGNQYGIVHLTDATYTAQTLRVTPHDTLASLSRGGRASPRSRGSGAGYRAGLAHRDEGAPQQLPEAEVHWP
jgi:PAS domain S-box-containing protein